MFLPRQAFGWRSGTLRMVSTHASSRRRLLVQSALATLCSLTMTNGVRADRSTSPLLRCVHGAIDPLSAGGDARLDAPEFMLAGDTRVRAVEFEHADCRGFLAVGAKLTQDIELRVESHEGKLLAGSEGPTTAPFVFYCGAKGERVELVLRVLDGQGEVVYAPLSHAQLDVSAKEALERCEAVGTPRPAPVDVGPEPQGPAVEEEVARVSADLAPLGYRPLRTATYGTLVSQAHNASVLRVEPGRCYALAAIGSGDVPDMDLRVFDPEVSQKPVVEDTTRRRDGLVKLCAESEGRYVIDVASFQGDGAYAVQLYVLDEPPVLPPGITGASRISYAETVHRLVARGFVPELLDAGIVLPDASFALPVTSAAHTCSAFAAVAGGGMNAGKLELALTDELGEPLAFDASGARDPIVFDCPSATSARRVQLRTKDARGAARFVLLRGREPGVGVAAKAAVAP